MQKISGLILTLLFAGSLIAGAKDDALLGLSSEFGKTFQSPPSQFEAHTATWNSTVASVKDLVDKNSDKDLLNAWTDLSSNNKILLNAFGVLARQCADIGKFAQIETNATKTRAALKKATFIKPGKRDTRKVLLKLASYLVEASKIGAARVQICTGLSNIETIKTLTSLLAQMEVVRTEASGNLKTIESDVRAKANPAIQALEVEKQYVERRKKLLADLKAKQALKIEEISKASAELSKLQEGFESLNNTLAGLPEAFALTVYMAAYMSGAKEAEDKSIQLQGKIQKGAKDVMNLSSAMDRIDAMMSKAAPDLHLDRDRKKAMEAAEEVAKNMSALKSAVAEKSKKILEESGARARNLMRDYEDKAKTLPCKDARTIGGGQRALDKCEAHVIGLIKSASSGAKLSAECSDETALGLCATALGKAGR